MQLRVQKVLAFVRNYVLDWHVLIALTVPALFAALFPAYWMLICPRIWKQRPDLHRPGSWLLGYWLFACIVWFIFLLVCFYRTRADASKASDYSGSCLRRPPCSTSTEDLWSEDQYLPEAYLPSPDYMVSVNAVQPSVNLSEEDEEKAAEVDETWDYNYEEAKTVHNPAQCVHCNPPRFPLDQHYHSLGYLNQKLSSQGELWSRSLDNPLQLLGQPSGIRRSPSFRRAVAANCPGLPGASSTEDEFSYYHPQPFRKPYTNPASGSSSESRRSSVASSASGPGRPHIRAMGRNQRAMSGGTVSLSGATTSSDSGSADHHLYAKPGRHQRAISLRHPLPAPSRRHQSPSCPRAPSGRLRKQNAFGRGARAPSLRRSPHSFPPPTSEAVTSDDGAASPSTPIPAPYYPMFSSKELMSQSSLTSEELRSLEDVCAGRIQRSDSLVSDSKFDSILASLQSLASELEKDFDSSCEDAQQLQQQAHGDVRPSRSEGNLSVSSAAAAAALEDEGERNVRCMVKSQSMNR